SARGLCDPDLLGPEQRELIASVGLLPENLVVEVTERVAIAGNREVRGAVDRLRAEGVQFAVDDVGAGYASLQAVAEVEPQYLKFDLSLVRDIHQSRIKQGLLESLVGLAEKIDARVVAEGVEQAEEYHTLRELGVPLAQGFLFAAPQPEMHFDLRLPE
ncbi:MAG: EAL domain-containing protein, partial [Thermoanaerobaculia bacterium]|nr:EAL domain-containing protein [Thermoanaerobaculia bacterium]